MGKGHKNNMCLCVKERRELEDAALAKSLHLFIVRFAAIWVPANSVHAVSVLQFYIRPW